MGHAQIKETQVYAKIVNEELDKAMDVFDDWGYSNKSFNVNTCWIAPKLLIMI